MFLKLFEPIFSAFKKDLKIGLIAVLVVVVLSVGYNGEKRVRKAQDDCADERKDDRATIASQAAELKDMRQRLMDFAFGKVETEKKTQENDSIIREQTNKELNKVMP